MYYSVMAYYALLNTAINNVLEAYICAWVDLAYGGILLPIMN